MGCDRVSRDAGGWLVAAGRRAALTLQAAHTVAARAKVTTRNHCHRLLRITTHNTELVIILYHRARLRSRILLYFLMLLICPIATMKLRCHCRCCRVPSCVQLVLHCSQTSSHICRTPAMAVLHAS